MLPVAFRRRLQVTHQARIEDIDDARAKYAELSIAAELATYLPDMPEQLAWTHLVIARARSEEHTSELQSLMRISYAVFCLKKKTNPTTVIITDISIKKYLNAAMSKV